MVSHQHRTVFVHVPKTGGQSIETLFLGLLGLDWESRDRVLMRPNRDARLGPPRLAHLSAAEYVRLGHLPAELFDAYFVFSFVRDPWDRAASFYAYLGQKDGLTLSEYVCGPLRRAVESDDWFFRPQIDFLRDDGAMSVDFLGRFERFQADFDRVCGFLGLPAMPLPRVNASASRQAAADEPGRWTWTREAIDRVARLYAADVEALSYAPPAVGTLHAGIRGKRAA